MTEFLSWIRLSLTLSPSKFWAILKKHHTAQEALKNIDNPVLLEKVNNCYENCQRLNIKILCANDPSFPESLKILNDCPPILYIKGNQDLLHKNIISIVGSRNASILAKDWTQEIASGLSENEWIIGSGMAKGIDSAAHRGSLSRGTIAVLAGGAEQIYPLENKALYEQICQKGCVISENPPGTPPRADLFPKRNRLIAALAKGILIVEAKQGSGSLITARYALELGKDIFAVPGAPWDARSFGANYLIKDGAILCESIEDINSHYGNDTQKHIKKQNIIKDDEDGIEGEILSHLSTTPIPLFQILNYYTGQYAIILSKLSEMEIDGKIKRYPNGTISL